METFYFALGLGGPEIFLILAVMLILFGAKKIPELARGMGKGIKEFKHATREIQDDLEAAMEDEPAPPPRRPSSDDSGHWTDQTVDKKPDSGSGSGS